MRETLSLFLLLGLACAAGKKDGEDGSENGADNGSDNAGDNGSDNGGDSGSDNGGDNGGGGSYWYDDIDGDGYGNPDTRQEAASQPADTVADGTDCNDLDRHINPGADEVCDGGVDNDCDDLADDDDPSVDTSTGTTWYLDGDGDGHAGRDESVEACTRPPDAFPAQDADDCDDSDETVHPDAEEVCGDGVDNNCDESGAPCVFEGSTADEADVKYLGGGAADHAGSAVAVADVNGDGDQDLIIGAEGADAGSYEPGEVIVYTTNATGTVRESSAFTTLNMGTSSEADNAYFGSNVSSLGDMDGDGYDDFIVGARSYSSARGIAEWYRGGSSIRSSTGYEAGEANSDFCGISVAGGPKADGSGRGKPFAVGCPGDGDGSVFVRSSLTGGASEISYSSSTGDHWGVGVVLGDVDGDGVDDLIGGAGYDSGSQIAYLLLGPYGGGSVSSLADDSWTSSSVWQLSYSAVVGDPDNDGYNDFILSEGYTRDAWFFPGGAVRPLSAGLEAATTASDAYASGDVNGDGVTDVAYTLSNGFYLVYGPWDGSSGAERFFTSGSSGDDMGASITIGDLSNDGFDDVVVGGTGDSDAGSEAGAVWVFFGGGI